MLNKEDIGFLIKALDKTNIVGIQSSMKLNEVFLKLKKMLEELDNEKSKEVVSE